MQEGIEFFIKFENTSKINIFNRADFHNSESNHNFFFFEEIRWEKIRWNLSTKLIFLQNDENTRTTFLL